MTQLSRVPHDRDADERAIRAVEAAYDAPWGAGDVEGLLDCLTDDAVLVNPRGTVARGHAEIRRKLGGFLKGQVAGSKHSSVVSRVEFVTADVAIVDGEPVVEGADRSGASLVHGYTDLLVRRDGAWLIAHIRAYGLTTLPPADSV